MFSVLKHCGTVYTEKYVNRPELYTVIGLKSSLGTNYHHQFKQDYLRKLESPFDIKRVLTFLYPGVVMCNETKLRRTSVKFY